MVARLIHSKSVPALPVLLVALVVSTGVVLGSIPRRWEGAATGTERHVPLRRPTPPEAAALLQNMRGTAILAMDDHEVTLATRVFVLEAHSSTNRAFEFDPITVGDRVFRPHSATFENFVLQHEVDRASLERALGRQLLPAEVDPSFLETRWISYASSYLPLYAAFEIIFLTLWIWGTALLLSQVRRWALYLPALFVCVVPPSWLILFVYSPAFFDADWFYQRIVLEEVAFPLLLSASPFLALAAVLSAAAWAVIVIAERTAVSKGLPPRRYHGHLLIGVIAVLGVGVTWEGVSHWRLARQCDDALDVVEGRVTSSVVQTVLQDPAIQQVRWNLLEPPVIRGRVPFSVLQAAFQHPAMQGSPNLFELPASPGVTALKRVLREDGLDRRFEIRVFVKTAEAQELFLRRDAALTYADFRNPEHTDGLDKVTEMRCTGRSINEAVWALRPQRICGRLLREAGNEVALLVGNP